MKLSSSAVKYPETVISVRSDYMIALVPALLWSIYRFGSNVIHLMLVSSCTAVLFEFLLKSLANKKPRVPDFYSIYMGLVFSLTLFSQTSWLLAAIGGAISVLIFRFIGAKGQCFIFAPFAARILSAAMLPELLNAPTDLACQYLYTNSIPAASTYDFILGTVNKSIGSVSAIAIIIGAIYLLLRKNTNRISAISFFISAFLLMFFFPIMEGRGMESAINEILAGDLLFVFAFVMTDFSWAPRSTLIKFLTGVLGAGVTFLLIRAGVYTDAYYVGIVLIGFISFTLDKLFFKFKYLSQKKGETLNADQ
jgi:electron transport complex protein RnfD